MEGYRAQAKDAAFLLLRPGESEQSCLACIWHIQLCNAPTCRAPFATPRCNEAYRFVIMAHHSFRICSGERDEAWPGEDLMEFFQLKRLYDFSLRALEKPSAYLKGVPGDTTLYRCACCRKSSLTSSLEHGRAVLRARTSSAEAV